MQLLPERNCAVFMRVNLMTINLIQIGSLECYMLLTSLRVILGI